MSINIAFLNFSISSWFIALFKTIPHIVLCEQATCEPPSINTLMSAGRAWPQLQQDNRDRDVTRRLRISPHTIPRKRDFTCGRRRRRREWKSWSKFLKLFSFSSSGCGKGEGTTMMTMMGGWVRIYECKPSSSWDWMGSLAKAESSPATATTVDRWKEKVHESGRFHELS